MKKFTKKLVALFCVISLPLNVGVLEALVPIASEPVYSNAKSNVSESLSNPFSATDQVLVICLPGPEYPLTLIPCVCEFAANAVNDIPISIAVDSRTLGAVSKNEIRGLVITVIRRRNI